VWGYFKEKADEKEKKSFLNAIQKSKEGASYQKVKNILFKLTQKYNEAYLLKSYYFYL
jgi:UV DNA damage endonuclease